MHSIFHDTIIYWDHVAWYYLNTQWHNAVLDNIAPFLRNPVFWAPLYLFLLIFMPLRFKRAGWIWCLLFLVSFIISDQVSATFMKPYFHRLRPCHNPYLTSVIHLLVPCGGQYGFPSSHAANHFSLAVFASATLGKLTKWIWPAAIIWALLVAWAQVYVGVHYPLDVTCGGLLGICTGMLTGKLFNRYFSLVTKQPEVIVAD